MANALICVVNVHTGNVPFYTVANDSKADELLDQLRERFKSPKNNESESDLVDDLWVEDSEYDYHWFALDNNETPIDFFKEHFPQWRFQKNLQG